MKLKMNPDLWGPHLWKSMHFIALSLPINPSDMLISKYYAFYTQLHHVIPCRTCAIEYEKLLGDYPLTLDRLRNGEELFMWTVEIHNLVNDRLGKPRMSPKEAKIALLKTSEKSEKWVEQPKIVTDILPSRTCYDTIIELIEASLLIITMLIFLLSVRRIRK
jgi:hypothetical protein